MDVEYRDPRLGLVESDRAAGAGVPLEIVESLRDKLVLIRAMRDERSLRAWKSLHYGKLERPGDQRSIRINKKWRLVFTIDTKVIPNKITVLGVEDYH